MQFSSSSSFSRRLSGMHLSDKESEIKDKAEGKENVFPKLCETSASRHLVCVFPPPPLCRENMVKCLCCDSPLVSRHALNAETHALQANHCHSHVINGSLSTSTFRSIDTRGVISLGWTLNEWLHSAATGQSHWLYTHRSGVEKLCTGGSTQVQNLAELQAIGADAMNLAYGQFSSPCLSA